ncbi:sodium- and chloride-dependent GABA transporter 2-like [Ruditapes philippinarum]|uniref:sodium- and chloride-dependent GABA transporter 2-like n=1 Tax=Ruditapes philippinarum TaxID=129788 RepID=UPI00295A7EDA|nr:sodium- and chloride-dependent GABA transporter 2-like [Ruditapes philippinarum]
MALFYSGLGIKTASYPTKCKQTPPSWNEKGMSVGIVAYITALSSLPFPQIWTVCFLAAIILTGIDGQLVPMDMLMQLIGDVFPRVRRGFRIHALVVTGVIFFLCSLPTCTGAGAYIFLWTDWYNGAMIVPILAFIQLVVVAWVYGLYI